MDKIVDKNKCSGCTACASICSQKAITMIEDEEGFKHPVIDKKKCIDCGLCKRTCPVLNTKENDSKNKLYVAYNKDSKSKLDKASSGSIFELLANYILDNKGIVIGAAFDQENKLKHIAIETKKDLTKLKGSKYLQSDLNNIFEYIKENVKEKKILFVGTPCQVAGLKSFIKKGHENLYCVDLFCHGVPTPRLFNKYIKELENKYNEKVINYNFRDKVTGWENYSNTVKFKNKKISKVFFKNEYMQLFLSDVALRRSCYNCNFKLGNKYSDLTLGDFWGVDRYYPDMYNKEGVSAIIINSDKGIELFETLKKDLVYKDCKIEEILCDNQSLKHPVECPSSRKNFFNDLENLSVKKLASKYKTKLPLFIRIKNKIKKIIKPIILKTPILNKLFMKYKQSRTNIK
jgi:coenzyme F420-reducing hydrogenase beta subunit